ncbi:MAG: hypothetical protein ACREA2_16185, partial [Blastocatellia bacterium]
MDWFGETISYNRLANPLTFTPFNVQSRIPLTLLSVAPQNPVSRRVRSRPVASGTQYRLLVSPRGKTEKRYIPVSPCECASVVLLLRKAKNGSEIRHARAVFFGLSGTGRERFSTQRAMESQRRWKTRLPPKFLKRL